MFAYRLSSSTSDARRIWFWRNSPIIFTGFVCFFAGGFISEVVQSTLPVSPLYPAFILLWLTCVAAQGIPDWRCGSESSWIVRRPLHILPPGEILPTSTGGIKQIP